MWMRSLHRSIVLVWLLGATAAADEAPAIDELKSEQVEARREAALALRAADRAAQVEALPKLIDRLMVEKDGQVRLAVLDTLAALGPDASPAVPALLHTLRTDYGGQAREESHQDYRSALALAAIGEPAVEGLRGLLEGSSESVRAESVMALGRIGGPARSAIGDLIPLLGADSERLRREAELALGRIGTASIEPLVAASRGQEPRIRAAALRSMGHLNAADARVEEAILAGAGDSVLEVRAAALGSLAVLNLADDRLRPILAENLGQADDEVRRAVINQLIRRRELLRSISPELENLLSVDDAAIARDAAYLLQQIGRDAAPILLRALPVRESRIEQIAEALAQLGQPVQASLDEAIGSPEPHVRRGAALALGSLRPVAPGTIGRLTVGLSDPDGGVKAACLAAIGSLGPRAFGSAPTVRSCLTDASAEIRAQSILVLSRIAPRDERLADDLAALIDDGDPRVQCRAIETIASLGPAGRKALAAVAGKLQGQDQDVRLAAARFVGTQGRAAGEALPDLVALLDDPNPELQRIAAETLGKIGQDARPALDRLVPLLDREDAQLREAAVTALASLQLEAGSLRPHLAKALRDGQPEVRRAAMRAVQQLGPEGALLVPDLIRSAENKDTRGAVERLLRRFERTGPDARSIPELVAQLSHGEAKVRLLASKFLGLAGPTARESIPALEGLSQDPSDEVRKEAAAACALIKKSTEGPSTPSATSSSP